MSKSMLWLFILVGSTIGGYLPSLFIKNAGFFSIWGIIGGALGAIAGIWIWRRFDF